MKVRLLMSVDVPALVEDDGTMLRDVTVKKEFVGSEHLVKISVMNAVGSNEELVLLLLLLLFGTTTFRY